jgi:predicted molibdopterin-dependent oxidoreductase YjgC
VGAAWHVEAGRAEPPRGLTTTEILAHAHPGGVRALYIMGENPMMTEPNLNLTRQHMEQLEFLVAQDLFINESGAFADVFLPATSWAEKEGTFTNTDRRVQRVRKAIPRAARRGPTTRSSATWRGASRRGWGARTSAGWDYAGPEADLPRDGERGDDVRRHHLRAHRPGGAAIPCAR